MLYNGAAPGDAPYNGAAPGDALYNGAAPLSSMMHDHGVTGGKIGISLSGRLVLDSAHSNRLQSSSLSKLPATPCTSTAHLISPPAPPPSPSRDVFNRSSVGS